MIGCVRHFKILVCLIIATVILTNFQDWKISCKTHKDYTWDYIFGPVRVKTLSVEQGA